MTPILQTIIATVLATAGVGYWFYYMMTWPHGDDWWWCRLMKKLKWIVHKKECEGTLEKEKQNV